jgi:hypothetical protein
LLFRLYERLENIVDEFEYRFEDLFEMNSNIADIPDLDGVPETHYWWKEERNKVYCMT